MKVIEPGHSYTLAVYDFQHWLIQQSSPLQGITFFKRCGPGYPGNKLPAHPGTNIQEVLRVLIDRHQYLNGQKWHWINPVCIFLYRVAINQLEYRAARRHGKWFRPRLRIEKVPTNPLNGHLF